MPSDEQVLREIGRRIVQLRRARGISQKALARKAQLSESHVYRIEQGSNMSIETLLAVARALGVAVAVFFSADPIAVDAPPTEYRDLDGPRPQLREAAVERVSSFVQGLGAEQRRRAMRLLRAAFPDRDP
jgi:transcriptional regulator with XRE-family HTH domain